MSAVTLVVPCYDEARRLDVAAFRQAVDRMPEVKLVLVDDGSRDGTRDVLERLATDRPERIDVLSLDRNRGKGEAVRRGIQHALAQTPDLFGYWDADLATPFEAVADLQAVLADRPTCLLAMGARVQLLGRDIQRKPWRHYAGRVVGTFAALTLGAPVYDTQCGAKLFRRTASTTHLFDEPLRARWIFDVELLARLRQALAADGGASLADVVVEVPLKTWIGGGESRVRVRDFLVGTRDLWRIHRRYRGERHAATRG